MPFIFYSQMTHLYKIFGINLYIYITTEKKHLINSNFNFSKNDFLYYRVIQLFQHFRKKCTFHLELLNEYISNFCKQYFKVHVGHIWCHSTGNNVYKLMLHIYYAWGVFYISTSVRILILELVTHALTIYSNAVHQIRRIKYIIYVILLNSHRIKLSKFEDGIT